MHFVAAKPSKNRAYLAGFSAADLSSVFLWHLVVTMLYIRLLQQAVDLSPESTINQQDGVR